MTHAAVLGAGSWGTAFAQVLADAGRAGSARRYAFDVLVVDEAHHVAPAVISAAGRERDAVAAPADGVLRSGGDRDDAGPVADDGGDGDNPRALSVTSTNDECEVSAGEAPAGRRAGPTGANKLVSRYMISST